MRFQSPDNLEGPRGYVQLQSDQALPDFIDANKNQLHPDLTHTVVTHLVRQADPLCRCFVYLFRSGCKTNNVCLLRAVNPGAKMISSRPFWRPTPGSLTAPLPVRVLPKLVWSSDSYGFVFSTCSLCIGIHGFSRSTPSSLQGEYRAGGHVHTPSRAAPPMELNRKAAPLTYLLTYFTIHRDVSRQVRSGTKAMPSSVRCLDWSPAGCAPDGGCVIAVCSSDYRVRHVTPWLQSARWHSDEPDVTQYRRPIEDPHHTRDAASVISRPPPLATNLLTAATSPLSAASCRVVAITAAPVRH